MNRISSMIAVACFSVASVLLPGCASIVNGTNQSVSVNTAPVAGATCSLENNKGKWYVNQTPGSVMVHRSYKDLIVNCEKPGAGSGRQVVTSKTKGMAFGNILFGGVVGAGVDMADGSAYDYPINIQVPMSHKS